jgi:hypothetical protein
MTIRAARLTRIHSFMLLLAALLLMRVGPFCEMSVMAAGTTSVAMAGCADTPVAPTDGDTTAECTMTSCVALADVSAGLAVPVIHAASSLPLPSFAASDGLEPVPATPPPRSA